MNIPVRIKPEYVMYIVPPSFTHNAKNFGKHSGLLKITDGPLTFVKEEIKKMNEEYQVVRIEYDFKFTNQKLSRKSHIYRISGLLPVKEWIF